LGNTVTTLNNMTLANVTISSGNVTITNVSVTTANVTTLNAATVIATTANVTTANITTGNVTTANITTGNVTNMTSGNVTITGGSINGTTLGATTASTANVTTLTTSSTVTINGGTANGVAYLNASKVLTTGSALTFDGTNLGLGGAPVAVGSSPVLEIYSGANNGILKFTNSTTGTTNSDGTWLYQPAGSNNFIVQNQESAGDLRLFSTTHIWGNHNYSTEYMRLTSTGLGIGTSSPNAKLTVGDSSGAVLGIPTTATFYGTSSISSSVGTVGLFSTETAAADVGPVLTFGGKSGNSFSPYPFAFIQGAKASATAGDYSGYLRFFTVPSDGSGPVERLRIDASGNLGLGVTPSAWGTSEWNVFEGAYGGALAFYKTSNVPVTVLTSNAYYDSGWKYKTTDPALQYEMDGNLGTYRWYTAPSGTAGNAISFTQAMTLDASGNLGVGATSITGVSGYQIIETRGSTGGIYQTSASGNSVRSRFYSTSEGGFVGTPSNHFLGFITNDTERARITSGGDLFLGATTSALNGTRFLSFTDANQSAITARCTNGSLGNDVLLVRATRNTTNNSYSAISYYNDGAGAYRFIVADSGNVTNTNGSYGTISDAKMKTDIVDAGSQWADIKAIRFRKFKMKNDSSRFVQLGVVAQELEQTSPGLVEEHSDKDAEGNDLGTTTKSVKTSVLLMKAAVALQEAMARIETLEAKIAALEAK
jgi:hypothetical protein